LLLKEGEMKCTWKDCMEEATIPQLDKGGKQWANLCNSHHVELEDAISSGNPALLLSRWIRAAGGASAMAKRF